MNTKQESFITDKSLLTTYVTSSLLYPFISGNSYVLLLLINEEQPYKRNK